MSPYRETTFHNLVFLLPGLLHPIILFLPLPPKAPLFCSCSPCKFLWSCFCKGHHCPLNTEPSTHTSILLIQDFSALFHADQLFPVSSFLTTQQPLMGFVPLWTFLPCLFLRLLSLGLPLQNWGTPVFHLLLLIILTQSTPCSYLPSWFNYHFMLTLSMSVSLAWTSWDV